jgi:hypothetical protein
MPGGNSHSAHFSKVSARCHAHLMGVAATLVAGIAVRDFVSGGTSVQTTQPRDFGALALVVGLFVILLVVTLTVGGPAAAIR